MLYPAMEHSTFIWNSNILIQKEKDGKDNIQRQGPERSQQWL